MTKDDRQLLKPLSNGPYHAENVILLKSSDNSNLKSKKSMMLCRCGQSSTKPYCDGTHRKVNFNDEKLEGGPLRKVDVYKGKNITINDNRGICAHIGRCTDELPSVFRLKTEPWIDPDAEDKDTIIKTIRKCPSGALSYFIDETVYDSVDRVPSIIVSKDGPYFVQGGIDFEDPNGEVTESPEHYALCRCGGSKNKPFCDGTHWYIEFKDDADWAKNQLDETAGSSESTDIEHA